MKTDTAIKLAGASTALADLLGITVSAVSQWGDRVPDLRVYQLKEIKPEWFIAPAELTPATNQEA